MKGATAFPEALKAEAAMFQEVPLQREAKARITATANLLNLPEAKDQDNSFNR